MAFSNTVLDSGMGSDGKAFERGTWNGSAVTTGNITAGSGTGFPSTSPKIGFIETFALASDGDTAVLPARDQSDNVLKITFTSGDTGTYYIKGPSVG